jgi:hypothetical protein
MTTTRTTDEIKNEWLQFLEFIKRKYGYNSSEYIRINHYNERSDKSVARYYRDKNPSLNISGNENLTTLLKNSSFINLLDLNNPINISKFTEIYNDTNHLMTTLSDVSNDIYIQCDPVIELGAPETTSSNGTNSTGQSNLTKVSNDLTAEKIFQDPIFMFFLPIMICLALFLIAKFLTYTIPKHMENAKEYAKGAKEYAKEYAKKYAKDAKEYAQEYAKKYAKDAKEYAQGKIKSIKNYTNRSTSNQ